MTKLVVDAAFLAKLGDLQGSVEFCDESGRTLGYFHPTVQGGPGGAKVESPFTDEEIQRRRQQRSGRPLGEILEDLNRS